MDATFAIDISLGGVLLAGPDDLAPGEKVVLVIDGANAQRPCCA